MCLQKQREGKEESERREEDREKVIKRKGRTETRDGGIQRGEEEGE
jgi:hypothetical protein